MSKEKYGFVYIWRDKKHKRYYVGCHWGSEDDGYICSSKWMIQAYFYRPQDFKRKIIRSNILSRQKMLEEEYYWLSMIKKEEMRPIADKPKYYNLSNHHFNHWTTDENSVMKIGEKISVANKGRKHGPISEERRQKISIKKRERDAAMRELTGGYTMTEEVRQRMSETKKGSTHTQEWKDAHSARLRDEWAAGIRKSNGPSSEETCQKISQALKGKSKDSLNNIRIILLSLS